MEKKKIILKKEGITKLENMSQIRGGEQVWTIIKDTATIAISALAPVTCTIVVTIQSSDAHCPALASDENTCTCPSRFCLS